MTFPHLPLALLLLAALQSPGDDELAFRIEQRNPGLPRLEDPPNLETPQSSVESFVHSAARGDFARAAHSLDFRLVDDLDARTAERWAEQLHYVLNQELWIDWEDLPDRPDGVKSTVIPKSDPLAGEPRRSLRLGTIDSRGRPLPVRVHRVSPRDGTPPVWMFSAQTVEDIPELYDEHGPSWLAQRLPDWARARGPFRVAWWQWGFGLIGLLLGYAAGQLTFWLVRRAARVEGATELAGELSQRLRVPVATLAGLAVVHSVVSMLNLAGPVAVVLGPLFVTLLIALGAWVLMRIIGVLFESIVQRYIDQGSDDDSGAERRLLTQISVARRVVLLLVASLAVGFLLLQFGIFETVGMSLLASAGAAAALIGIAGHAVIGNLIAGLQIAFSRPFRIGDSVYVEGNWGRVEDIAYTYVTIRTWDHRRLIFPVRYFLSNYIENWSIVDRFLVKPIYLHLDYRADVQAVREKFLELVEADDESDDKREPEVLVTETAEESITLRCACGARNSSAAWDLHCRLREQMVAWLQEVDAGRYLPQRRLLLERVEGGVS